MQPLSEVLALIAGTGIVAIAIKWWVEFTHYREEAEKARSETIKKVMDDESKKVHDAVNSEPIDQLIDESGSRIYDKIDDKS